MYSTHDITVLKGQCSWLGTRSCISAITSLTSHIRLTWQKPNSIQQNQIYRSSECGVILTLWFYYKQTRNYINNFLAIVFVIKFYITHCLLTLTCRPMTFNFEIYPSISNFSVIFFLSTKTNINKASFFLFHSWKQLWGKWEGESYFQHLNLSHSTVASRPCTLVWGPSVSLHPLSPHHIMYLMRLSCQQAVHMLWGSKRNNEHESSLAT